MMFFLSILLAGCVSAPIATLDSDVYYKRDLQMKISGREGREGRGHVVAPHQDVYEINIKFPGKGDLVTFKTCHREIEVEKAGTSETVPYRPVAGIENTGLCFLEISVFEQGAGRHAWGIIDFENPQFTLDAVLKCNGSTTVSRGTSICASKAGLIQRIEFPEAVVGSDKSKCPPLPTAGRVVEFKMPERECTYILKGASGKLHKLTTIGHEKILIRKN
jgi:hypothetical protein